MSERRVFVIGGPGVRALSRAEGAAGGQVIEGHGAVFNTPAVIAGLFEEVIAPGAFTRAIQEDDCRGLFNHDPNWIMGRKSAGTLRLSEDAIGLAYSITLPATGHGDHVGQAVTRGDVSGSSFSFDVLPDGERWDWPTAAGMLPRRTLLSVKLWDVGPVTFPAYVEADVTAAARGVLLQAEARAGRQAGGGSAVEVLEAAEAARGDLAGTIDRRRRFMRAALERLTVGR